MRKIIDRNDNWNEVFKIIFRRKEDIIPLLIELEPIRNAIAHNRKITTLDQRVTEKTLEKIQLLVRPRNFSRLVSRCSTANAIPTTLTNLQTEGDCAYKLACSMKPVSDLPNWAKVESSWWYDPDYLLNETTPVTIFFTKLMEYRLLPRERGSGHNIESWLRINMLDEWHLKAMQTLEVILGALND